MKESEVRLLTVKEFYNDPVEMLPKPLNELKRDLVSEDDELIFDLCWGTDFEKGGWSVGIHLNDDLWYYKGQDSESMEEAIRSACVAFRLKHMEEEGEG